MKNLNLNGFDSATTLSRDEMKNVMGGIISAETYLQMCYDGKNGGSGIYGNNEAQNEINKAICDALYEDMTP
ncbi:hypothetical protein ACHMWN_06890 [Pedobacter sp. UC225_61]|uniref:hypothetical protein n=1 Tax=Pedobacter sp. UC225_61 TaxID=3374623 RepID=UPI0037A459A3